MAKGYCHREKKKTTTQDAADRTTTVMASWRASRLALAALLVVCTAAVGATKVTDTCCDAPDGSTCCPMPPIADNAENVLLPASSKQKVVYDQRCCLDESAVGCTAYGVAGCSFCRDVCDQGDDSCVVCPISPASPREPEEEDATSQGTSDDSRMIAEFDADQTPGSYDYSDPEQYECSNCSWDSMSKLEQRLLTQRSRSMVCDSSCLHDSGDPNYGVTLCNYFKAGKECRACCHVSHTDIYGVPPTESCD